MSKPTQYIAPKYNYTYIDSKTIDWTGVRCTQCKTKHFLYKTKAGIHCLGCIAKLELTDPAFGLGTMVTNGQ